MILIVKYWLSFDIYYLNFISVYIYDLDYYVVLYVVNYCVLGILL